MLPMGANTAIVAAWVALVWFGLELGLDRPGFGSVA